MRTGVLTVLVISVVGCTAPRPYYPVSPASPSQAVSVVDSCPYVAEHQTSDGTGIPSGYVCSLPLANSALATSRYSATPASQTENPSLSASASTASLPSDCTFVAGYTRKDGNTVSSHIRCKTYSSALVYRNSSSLSSPTSTFTDPAPCVTSSCGSVNVKGYYRKDGTYVRPHTRRR